jgi:hypothetical protein
MHADEAKNYLAPYGINTWGQLERGNPAPDDSVARVVEVKVEGFDVGEASYQVVREIYLWFGLEEDKIPYTTTEGESGRIDPEQIKKL